MIIVEILVEPNAMSEPVSLPSGLPPAPVGAVKVLKSRGGGALDFGWEDELPAGTIPDIGDVTLIFENHLI
jgi:hypothetical protein